MKHSLVVGVLLGLLMGLGFHAWVLHRDIRECRSQYDELVGAKSTIEAYKQWRSSWDRQQTEAGVERPAGGGVGGE
jgi:hypothetical protein